MGYGYTRSITIASAQCGASNSTAFPVLLTGTFAYLANTPTGNVENANGFDIIFTSDVAGTTLLNWEIESYDASTGAVNFWISIPTVSHTVDTVFYMFYGNAAISTFQGGSHGAAWNSAYSAVYHFNGTAPDCTDWTANANDLGNAGASAGTATTGQIDGGIAYNGTTQLSTRSGTTALPTGTNPRSVECWFKTGFSGGQNAFGYGDNGANGDRFSIFTAPVSGSNIGIEVENDLAYCSYTPDNAWHHIAVTLPSGQTTSGGVKIYLDGVLQTTTSQHNNTLNTSAARITSGAVPGLSGGVPFGYWTGAVDEGRISSVARTDDWYTTQYNNQKTGSTFLTISAANVNMAGSQVLMF